MRGKERAFILGMIFLVACGTAQARWNVRWLMALPQGEAGPDPRANNMNLAQTMKLIQDQTNGQGRVDVHKEGAANFESYTVAANPATCRLTVIEEQRFADSSANNHTRKAGSFKDIWQMILTKHEDFARLEILGVDDVFKNQTLSNYKDGLDIEKDENFPEETITSRSLVVDFKDVDRADLVARAIVHAALLCTPDNEVL